MQAFNPSSLIGEASPGRSPAGARILRTPSLSMGLYHLEAGQVDEQQPHTEDEVYFVVSGRASFRAARHEQTIEPGSVIFVERDIEHRFVNITEDLTVLVFFAPAEGSLRAGAGT
ncbi:MAG: cupin domain-containing protein [Gemmataceae bacterium]